MQVVELSVDINHEEIRKAINNKIEEAVTSTLFLVDIVQLSKITSMSRSFLEKEIICDPRMKILERRKEKGKRYWFAKESLDVIREIINEW